MQDHPRIRGTNATLLRENFPSLWIIPAYAGQISISLECFMLSRDHPRIRGTNVSKISTSEKILWIIPAYAGQMPVEPCNRAVPEDHPRIRGTNFDRMLGKNSELGSSPHTRDKYLKIP